MGLLDNLSDLAGDFGKDALLSMVKSMVLKNLGLEKLGDLIDLDLDSNNKTISFGAMLNGEEKSIDSKIHYNILEEGESKFLEIKDVDFSREWINTLFNDFLPDSLKKIELPESVSKYVNMLM